MASGGRAERWVSRSRTHNKQNEITAVSGATSPTYDASGNLTTDETGRQFVYDAWNRIKVVKDSGGTTLKTYTYDATSHRIVDYQFAFSVTIKLNVGVLHFTQTHCQSPPVA